MQPSVLHQSGSHECKDMGRGLSSLASPPYPVSYFSPLSDKLKFPPPQAVFAVTNQSFTFGDLGSLPPPTGTHL